MSRTATGPPTGLVTARSILVRAPNWVGDAMMCLPALTRLRRLNPTARVVVVARPGIAALFESVPTIDECWGLDDQTRAGWMEIRRRVRAERFEFGLLFPNSFRSALLLRLAGVRRLRGFARDGRGLLLAEPVRFEPEYYSVHEVTNYHRLVDDRFEIGGVEYPLSAARPGFPAMEFSVTDVDRATLDSRLVEMGIDPRAPFLSITPGAAFGTAKRWPPERFAALAALMAEDIGLETVLVMGGDAETETTAQVCDAIARETGGRVAAHNLAGNWTLRLVAAVLERTRLHLTNDSGPMHMAAALGAPLVALFGSTDWITTAPWSARARLVRVAAECAPCLHRHCPIDHRCMERLTVDQARDAARELLERIHLERSRRS